MCGTPANVIAAEIVRDRTIAPHKDDYLFRGMLPEISSVPVSSRIVMLRLETVCAGRTLRACAKGEIALKQTACWLVYGP